MWSPPCRFVVKLTKSQNGLGSSLLGPAFHFQRRQQLLCAGWTAEHLRLPERHGEIPRRHGIEVPQSMLEIKRHA
jgi:hypothetical protein